MERRFGVFARILAALAAKGGAPARRMIDATHLKAHRTAASLRPVALLLPVRPRACELLGDRGYDSARFRAPLAERGITPCIPSTRSRKLPLPYDRTLCRQRPRIETMFGRLKDRRRLAIRYDRCAHTVSSAIANFRPSYSVPSLDPP